TVFVGRLSWNVDNDWLAQEFAECGEVVSARVQMDRNTGRSRGFGYVTFATTEAVEAALAMNGKEIDGRPVNIDKSEEKDKSEVREKRAQKFGDSASEPASVLFVGNLSFDSTEDGLWEVFGEYGEVKSVRVPTDPESGRPRGFGYIEYSDIESAKKALEALSGTEINGRAIRLDYSQPRDNNGGGRGGRGGGRRGRGGFGDRGGRGGGRGGSVRSGAVAEFQGTKKTF
ncbi:RNA-binding domain-containing protein, partial [Lentinus brumalis]